MKRALIGLHSFLGRHRILPSFDEDTVFLLAVAVLLVLSLDSEAQAFAREVASHSAKITLIVGLGMGFAFYTAFFTNFKNEIQKFYMFWFAVLMNFLAAFGALKLLGPDASAFSYVAPALNVTIFLLMVVFWHTDILDASSMPYKSSSYGNIFYGTVIVLGFVLLAEYAWDMRWPTVLGAAIGYATAFNHSLSGFLPQIFSRRDKKITALDAVVNRAINHVIETAKQGKHGPYSASIVTDAAIKDLDALPDGKKGPFLEDEVRKLDPHNAVVAVASLGTYSFKRYAFSRERQETAIIIDVYSNDRAAGHKFCQMIKRNASGDFGRWRGIIYIGKLSNIFV